MAPICGLCEGEMADLDFHLEGKCQNAIGNGTFGTEACNHRCHLPVDGSLQFGLKHPQHCITCDGSRPIPATMCDRTGCFLGHNHAVPDEHRCRHGILMDKPINGGVLGQNRQMFTCECCQNSFSDWFGTAPICLGCRDMSKESKFTDQRVLTLDYADNNMRGVATIHDMQLWLRGGRDLLGYCLCFVRPKSQCRFHAGRTITEGPHNIMLSPVSAEFLRSWLVGRKVEVQDELSAPLPPKQESCTCDAAAHGNRHAGGCPLWTWREAWTRVDETASPLKDINWGIDANIHRVKSWACKRGHSFQSEKQTIRFTDANGNMAESGPLCWLCVLDFANREFPAFEVKDG